MKKTLLFALLLSFITGFSQDFPYEFSVLQEDYVPITDGISLTNGEIWDDPDLEIPLGFGFHYFGDMATVIFIESDISLGAMLSTALLKDETTKIFLPFEADIIDGGEISGVSDSDISYKIEGSSPDRICKIQWNNCAFYEEVYDLETADDRVNFQVWLYETSFDIEYRYGPMTVNSPELNLFSGHSMVGMIGGADLSSQNISDCYILQGMTSDPEIESFSTVMEVFTSPLLDEVPSEGLVYRFGSTYVGVEEEKPVRALEDFQVYPTLVDNSFKINSKKKATYTIQNLAGELVLEGNINAGISNIDFAFMGTGLYFLHLKSNYDIQSFRLVKK